MTYIEKIHGIKRDGTTFSSNTNGFSLSETILVEAVSPVTTLAEVVSELPVFGSPGTTTFNPYQLTFTLNQSPHPQVANYYLNGVSNARRSTEEGDGCFWEFPVAYITASPFAGTASAPSDAQRKDQKVKKPDAPTDAEKEPIDNPLQRPAVWSGSTQLVSRPSFYDLESRLIKHTNGLPITTPVNLQVAHKKWSWSFNVGAASFDYGEWEVFENSCNANQLTFKQGVSTPNYIVLEKKLKCLGFSFSEHWETPANSDVEYHYVRVTMNVEISPDDWDISPVSMHTLAISNAAATPTPIPVNARGDTANDPWPLKPDGTAVHYDDLPTAVQADFGVLQVGTGVDQEDFTPVIAIGGGGANFQDLIDEHSLWLPKKQN